MELVYYVKLPFIKIKYFLSKKNILVEEVTTSIPISFVNDIKIMKTEYELSNTHHYHGVIELTNMKKGKNIKLSI